eukprot:6384712-Pyramimonas_sp.AAC.1
MRVILDASRNPTRMSAVLLRSGSAFLQWSAHLPTDASLPTGRGIHLATAVALTPGARWRQGPAAYL